METLFFFIIIGVLSAIFGKNSKQFQKSKPFIPKRLEDVRTLFESVPVPPKTIQNELENDTVTNLEEKYLQKRTELEYENIPVVSPEKQLGRMRMVILPEAEKEKSVPIETPDSQSLINGIIWSEILGEPRAKRPHSSGRR